MSPSICGSLRQPQGRRVHELGGGRCGVLAGRRHVHGDRPPAPVGSQPDTARQGALAPLGTGRAGVLSRRARPVRNWVPEVRGSGRDRDDRDRLISSGLLEDATHRSGLVRLDPHPGCIRHHRSGNQGTRSAGHLVRRWASWSGAVVLGRTACTGRHHPGDGHDGGHPVEALVRHQLERTGTDEQPTELSPFSCAPSEWGDAGNRERS